MSLGRRKVGLDEPSRWVFNRMADVYDARPPYPEQLIGAVAALAATSGGAKKHRGGVGTGLGNDARGEHDGQRDGQRDDDDGKRPRRVVDIGAGIGHLALPLLERGLEVFAVEPAAAMLARLQAAAAAKGWTRLHACHAAAEHLPLADQSVDLAVVADALHFLDAELTARELARVLIRDGGALAVITCEWGATPFMREVVRVIEAAVPRRPRQMVKQLVQISAITGIDLTEEKRFDDETPVDHATLDRILRSVSFIGPAMHARRFEEFRARVHALTDAPAWARTFVLRSGRR